MLLYKSLIVISFLFLAVSLSHDQVEAYDVKAGPVRPMVKRDERRSLIETEYGRISAAKISTDGTRRPYYLQFITLEPNSLFLPALLHADMVFYVHTGRGRLSWADEDAIRTLDIRRGDVYRLQPGSVFYIESNLEQEREKLRIYAIFSNTENDSYFEPVIGAYTSISDLILGFDRKVLQSAFKVSEDVIEELFNATRPRPIVHALPKKKKSLWAWEARFLKAFVGDRDALELEAMNGKKKKAKTYNILDADPDFKNCNGWSSTVDRKDLRLLKNSNIGIFMVNLTKGSMMGPHWNPMATEIAIVLHGQGMVRVVCPSTGKQSDCKNMRFKVEEGDAFAVPRFHPMAQMSFNNDSFVFVGFSTSTRTNYPQFLAGKRSVLQELDKQILSVSFNVSNTTINQLLAQQEEYIILDCTSCAEEEESIMQEEIRREREEEEAREREKERKREEEARKRQEEEEARKREEEEARRREEEEEARKRQEEEEEEARRREEEEKREQEEEERRREEARRQEEERQRREQEEEEEREREERREAEEEEREAWEKQQEEEKDERKKQRERERGKKKKGNGMRDNKKRKEEDKEENS
ncbi:Vicilin-like seed storage protein [Citrus sinensis]|uniref:vicilin-like seed storage protein At2g18540 n=1 Tax=Citrus sinensis TaxID=2711 RepID=UPI0003D6F910|nr:vicilin-like seed storage protein At2g18540 [Citrus sinensis]KAH9663260.1 Vicilin-like seed storage protein [Citrus sinensis]